MQDGADYLELDVHMTRDHRLVVLHDPTLERTTNGVGPVRLVTLAGLAALQLRHPAKGLIPEGIPSLSDLLSRLDDRVQLLLEIKLDNENRRYRGIEARVLEMLAHYKMRDRTIVMSFQLEHLKRLRALDPTIRLGGLLGTRAVLFGMSVPDYLEQLETVQASFVGFAFQLISSSVVEEARLRNFLVGAWTVNDLRTVDALVAQQVDILITDRPGAVRSHLGPAGSTVMRP